MNDLNDQHYTFFLVLPFQNNISLDFFDILGVSKIFCANLSRNLKNLSPTTHTNVKILANNTLSPVENV